MSAPRFVATLEAKLSPPTRTLIVGQAPSASAGHRRAFDGRSGARLAELMGIPHADMLKRFDTVNLIPVFPGKERRARGDRFSMREARRGAARVLMGVFWSRILVVGIATARAIGLGPVSGDVNVLLWGTGPEGATYGVVPHPSGLNRWWNDPDNERRGRAFLEEVARS